MIENTSYICQSLWFVSLFISHIYRWFGKTIKDAFTSRSMTKTNEITVKSIRKQ